MKTLLILTGWTRGLGEGILRAYADMHGKELGVVAVARGENTSLADSVRSKVGWMRTITADLANAAEVDRLVCALEASSREYVEACGVPEKSILFNNAATLGPIETLPGLQDRQSFHEEGLRAFALNCLAPALLGGWFLTRGSEKGLVGTSLPKRPGQALVVNVSSGASQGPMSGASVYSMTKAALNALSKSLVAEQLESSLPVKVVAISPGMVETSMQETLRAQPGERFPNVEYFREAAKDGTARNHIDVGRILASLDYDSLESGSYYHIDDFL